MREEELPTYTNNSVTTRHHDADAAALPACRSTPANTSDVIEVPKLTSCEGVELPTEVKTAEAEDHYTAPLEGTHVSAIIEPHVFHDLFSQLQLLTPRNEAPLNGDPQAKDCLREITTVLIEAVEAKDPHTRAHSMSVARFVRAIARRLAYDAGQTEILVAAAMLHDIGKLCVPDNILTKPGPLTATEYAIIQTHPQNALDILDPILLVKEERPLILHHHEWYDGSGYPGKLAGEQIPIGARVLAVADALDAMLSRRSYKEPYTIEHIRDELAEGAGTQFDPHIITLTLDWLNNPSTPHGQVAKSARHPETQPTRMRS